MQPQDYAAKPGEADYLRSAALKLLGEWAKPSKRDAITGLRQDLKDRDGLVAIEALKPVLAKVFSGSTLVRHEAAEMAKRAEGWQKPAPRYQRGVFAKYARSVSSAAIGAVTS